MSDKIYNKNAREKALLEEAYTNVYNEQLNQEVVVGAQVMWDGQRKRGQVEEVDVENGVAVVYDDDGGEHIVELDNFDVVLNPDTETPGDLKHHYGIEEAEDQVFGLVDASGNIVSLYDNEGIMRQVMEGRPDLKAITFDELPFNVDVT